MKRNFMPLVELRRLIESFKNAKNIKQSAIAIPGIEDPSVNDALGFINDLAPGQDGLGIWTTKTLIPTQENLFKPIGFVVIDPIEGRFVKTGDLVLSTHANSLGVLSIVNSRHELEFVGSIRGPAGEKGSTGATGATGPAGKGLLNYSTSEQSTGLTWIDGKTIYQKTIEIGALPDSTYKYVPYNISNLDKILFMQGAYGVPGGRVINLDGGTTNPFTTYIATDTGNITVHSPGDRRTFTNSWVTLYYTKK